MNVIERITIEPRKRSGKPCIRGLRITVPRVLTEALAAGGEEAKRAFDPMMPMHKIDVATIEKARRG